MASLITPVQCGNLRVGEYMMIANYPCKILEIKYCKTGKHGTRKAHFIAVDIFTDRKHEFMSGTSKNIDTPIVNKAEYQLVDISDDTISYLDSDGNCLNDLKLPCISDADNKLATQIVSAFESGTDVFISVISAMEISAIKGFRTNE